MKSCPNCSTQLTDVAKFCYNCGKPFTLKEYEDEDLKLLKKHLEPKITIHEKINQGGMAGVYKGEQVSLNRKVAIKILFPHLAKDKTLAKNFLVEAILAANLKHNNIVDIIDFGEIESRPYFIMEYAELGTLADRLNSLNSNQERLTIKESCSYILNILAALEAAHKKNMIAHRDIKPENILIRDSGTAFLTDFGIAYFKDTELTAGEVLGSFPYMSPEQIQGDINLDSRTDIYSLGIIFYQLITNEHPFSAKEKSEWSKHHLNTKVPDITSKLNENQIAELEQELINPKELQKIIEKATSKNKKNRFETAREMSNSIKKILKHKDSFFHPENIKNRRLTLTLSIFTTIVLFISGFFGVNSFVKQSCKQCCFQGDCENGIGSFRYQTNDLYEGKFRNKKPDGFGTYHFANGDKYEGDFSEGELEGLGTYHSKEKKEYFIGEFKNGKPNGRGTYRFANGSRLDSEFKEGIPSKFSTYYTIDRDRYEGQINLDKMIPNGKGILYYRNGDIYEGEFLNGDRHGKGELIEKKGNIFKGIWKKDKFISKD
jgi:serine/threonine protein kinase